MTGRIQSIADTHALIWYLFNDPQLSHAARDAFSHAAENGSRVGVSSISLAEIVYLQEKRRIPVETFGCGVGVPSRPGQCRGGDPG